MNVFNAKINNLWELYTSLHQTQDIEKCDFYEVAFFFYKLFPCGSVFMYFSINSQSGSIFPFESDFAGNFIIIFVKFVLYFLPKE